MVASGFSGGTHGVSSGVTGVEGAVVASGDVDGVAMFSWGSVDGVVVFSELKNLILRNVSNYTIELPPKIKCVEIPFVWLK